MTAMGHAESFAAAYLRLLNMLSIGISEAPPRYFRRAEIWADQHTANSFYWCIYNEAVEDENNVSRCLAGVLHFHERDQTWGIHT